MKQKRKVKSLIPQKKNWSESFLVMILLALSIALCLGSASLMTASVLGATPLPNISRPFTNITYTGLDDNQEVLYDMKFVDPNNLYRVVSDIYISGASLYISPSPVIVHPLNSLGQVDRTVNVVKSGVYSHILGGRNNDVRSANITLVAGEGNIVYEGSDNDSILGGKNHHQIYGGSAGSAPSVVAGGEDHFLGSSSDGVVFLGGNGNSVHSASTNGVLLGGKDNTISYVNNVIVGGSNIYDEMSANNIFAYSNFSSNFYPESSNAFYLNMLKGVGIGMDSDDKGLYVSGVVSVGEIDITSIDCNNSNYGVIGMFNDCIVGCTASGSSNAKRNMLDRSEHCLDVCDDYYSFCIPGSDPVPSHPDYPAFCITGDLDLNLDRVELCYPDLLNYENIVFQADLVDDCDSDNKCMYKCKEGYSREGTGCFSDCTMDWLDADDETFKHNVAFTGYSSGSLSCGILGDDGSDSECGNFGTGLVCYDGTIYLADNGGNYIPGSSVQAQSYNYRSCGLSGFDCDSTYNLDWLAVKFDFPENFNTVALPRFNIGDILTGIAGGVYELCVDYNVYGGQCRRSGYEFVKLGCNTASGYVQMPDGSCKKNCINGLAHGETGFYYASTGVECDGACKKYNLKCNNGKLYYSYEIYPGVFTSYEAIDDGLNPYPYTGCNLLDKVCDASYNVTHEEFLQWSGTADYVSCTNYSGNDITNECDMGSIVYKLVNCKPGYHTGDDNKHCILDTVFCDGPEPYGSGVIRGAGSFNYRYPPTYTYWNSVINSSCEGGFLNLSACQWTCECDFEAEGNRCVPRQNSCKNEFHFECTINGSASNTREYLSGYTWVCGDDSCHECKNGYTYDGDLQECVPEGVNSSLCDLKCPDDDNYVLSDDGICEYRLKVCMKPLVTYNGYNYYDYTYCFDTENPYWEDTMVEYEEFPEELVLCGNGKRMKKCDGGDYDSFEIEKYLDDIPSNLGTINCKAISVLSGGGAGGEYDKGNGGYYLVCEHSSSNIEAEELCECFGNRPQHSIVTNRSPEHENIRFYYNDVNINEPCSFYCEDGYLYEGGNCVPRQNSCKNEFHFECTINGSASNTREYLSGYTWVCGDDSCHECKNGYYYDNELKECVKSECNHCARNGFPYCFPIDFSAMCDESSRGL